MNRLKTILLVVLASIIQFSLVSKIEVFSASANILIPVTIALSLGLGALVGSYSGLAMGLIEDILFSPILGPKALFYFLAGFIVGINKYRLNVKDLRTGAFITGLATLAINLIGLIIGYFTGGDFLIADLLTKMVIEIILNSLLYVPIMKICRRVLVFPDIVFFG